MRLVKFTAFAVFSVFAAVACSHNSSNSTLSAHNTAVFVNNNSIPASSNTAPPTAAGDEFADARKIYTESCAICHKENGEGGAVKFEGAEFKVPSYKTDRAKNKSDEKLLDYIVNGDDEMPSFKESLTPYQMKSLVKFIRRDFQGK